MDYRVWQSKPAEASKRLAFYPYWLQPPVNNGIIIITYTAGNQAYYSLN